jgi:hypothetical protein
VEGFARTTYTRAIAGYDQDFERELADALARTIVETSRMSDVDAVVLRTAETASLVRC